MAKPRVYWRGLHSGTHQRDHYYTSLPQRPKCIHLNPIHWGIEILPSTKLLLLIICQNLFSLLVLFHLVYAVTLVITLIYSFSHFLWCPTRNGTVEILPVDDLYQDGISNNILCLKMEPKYNTVFIAGKKMLHRSGAGKLRIHFFYRPTKMVFLPTIPSFLFPPLILSHVIWKIKISIEEDTRNIVHRTVTP